ncbi:MAG: hypothetical protein ACHREM_12340 [Polyangiales bacterium]
MRPTHSSRLLGLVAVFATPLLLPSVARAALTIAAPASTAPLEGTVLLLDGADLVIDLGTQRGVHDGDRLELYRPLQVKHPVSGKVIRDRFQIGAIKITQARGTLSLGRADGALLRTVQVGDVALMPAPVVEAMPLLAAAAQAKDEVECAPEDATDPETKQLATLFEHLRGASPEVRAKAYVEFASAHVEGRFSVVLREEAASLQRPALTIAPKLPTVVALSFEAPRTLVQGRPVEITIEIAGKTAGAVLEVKPAGDVGFHALPMRAIGAGYWTATIDAALMKSGSLAYFIDAVNADGAAVPIVSSSARPSYAFVDTPPATTVPDLPVRTVSLWTDYADFNRLRGNDQALQTEGTFGLRFRDEGLRAVRSGFGVYRGSGGSVVGLDTQNLAARNVGLTYGYLEGELGITPTAGLIFRAILGLGETGVTGGASAFVRIGNDRDTNLLLGGEFLDGIGLRAITEVSLAMFPRVPILLRAEVTNQPAGTTLGGLTTTTSGTPTTTTASSSAIGDGDIGVRAIVQTGYRVTSDFTVFGRLSYQGRTIDHSGPGAGAGLSFQW